MGCTESVPVQEPHRAHVIYTQTPQNTNYNNQKTYKNEDPVNYNQKQPTYPPQQTVYTTQSSVPLGPPVNKVPPPPYRSDLGQNNNSISCRPPENEVPPPPYGYYNNTITPTAPPVSPVYSNSFVYPNQQQQYVVYQYPNQYSTQYPPQYNQYPPHYNQYPSQYNQYQQQQQPSMLATMGAVAGGVILGDMVSDALFD